MATDESERDLIEGVLGRPSRGDAGARLLPEHRRRHGVAVPPVRLRLNLGVQVEQVLTELLGIGCEVGAVRTRFAFGHRRLLSAAAHCMALDLALPR